MTSAHYICTGCQRLHDGKAGARCLDCARAHNRERNAQPHRRAHRTQAHTRLRELVLRRDGYRCVDCNTSSALTLDYLVPLQDGGQMTLDNAETRGSRALCVRKRPPGCQRLSIDAHGQHSRSFGLTLRPGSVTSAPVSAS